MRTVKPRDLAHMGTGIIRGGDYDGVGVQRHGNTLREIGGNRRWSGVEHLTLDIEVTPDGSDDSTPELKIEPGKWYRTRGGAKRYCVGHTPAGKIVVCSDITGEVSTRFPDGRMFRYPDNPADIIAEWQEPLSEDVELLLEWIRRHSTASLYGYPMLHDTRPLRDNPRKCIEEMREANNG